MRKRIDDKIALDLYNKGLTDKEIANTIGVCAGAVLHWRQKNELTSKFEKTHLDKEKASSLYSQGFCDDDIAKQCGVPKSRIKSWRKEMKYKANRCKGKKRQRKKFKFNTELAMDLYNKKTTDKEIAAQCGVSDQLIYVWRKANDLPSNFRSQIDADLAYRCYKKGLSDHAIAKKCGVCTTTVQKWRKEHKLPTHRSVSMKKEKKYMQFYKKGYNDKNIADKFHVKKSRVFYWRKRNKLSSNPTRLKISKSPLYPIWYRMFLICKKNPDIALYKDWNTAAAFIDWAKKNEYKEGMHLLRKNKSVGYCPENCEFVSERCQDRLNGVLLTIDGETKNSSEWARTIHLTRSMVSFWVTKYGKDYATQKVAQRLHVLQEQNTGKKEIA